MSEHVSPGFPARLQAFRGEMIFLATSGRLFHSTRILTTVPPRMETIMSFFPRRRNTQFDTVTFDCWPLSYTVSLLLNFLTGWPHFFTSALPMSPVFTIFLPHLKLSASTSPDSKMTAINNSNFRIVPTDLIPLVGSC